METVVLRIIKLCESAILVGQLRFVERVGGIEPPSPAWKAGVIAFIRYPHSDKGADSSVLPVSRQCLLFDL